MDLVKDLSRWQQEKGKDKLEIPITVSLSNRKIRNYDKKDSVSDYIILDVQTEDKSVYGQRVDDYKEAEEFLARAVIDVLNRYLKG